MYSTHIEAKFLSIQLQLQGSAKRRAPGLVNFVPAVAYHFFIGLPAAFTQPGTLLFHGSAKRRGCLLSYSQAEPGRELTQPSPRLLAEPCTLNAQKCEYHKLLKLSQSYAQSLNCFNINHNRKIHTHTHTHTKGREVAWIWY